MFFIKLKNQVKTELKILAKEIQQEKQNFKNNKNIKSSIKLENLKNAYRNKHIAYCQFFNHTNYDQIEIPKYNNFPDGYIINNIKNNWINRLN
jgi:hypothetical protein